jgi:hypothetical protein
MTDGAGRDTRFKVVVGYFLWRMDGFGAVPVEAVV